MEESFRTFIDWQVEEVVEWLKRLPLADDYSVHFHNAKMNGSKLLRMDHLTLDKLKVLDQSDRVVILQEVMALKAALLTSSRSASTHQYSHVDRYTPSPEGTSRGSPGPPVRAISTSPDLKENPIIRRRKVVSDRKASPRQRYSDVPASYQEHQLSPLLSQRRQEGSCKGVSRGSGWPLVEVLKEENMSLRKDLDYYHKKTRKLQKVEQEIEGIREAHQLLEVSTQRRETLEKAMRKKLEEDLKNQKEKNLKLQVELQLLKSANISNKKKRNPSKIELERRDSVIIQLLRKQRESLEAREKLEEDLMTTKAQLNQRMTHSTIEENVGVESTSSAHNKSSSDEVFTKTTTNTGEAMALYLGSIDRLRGALKSMQQMSNAREQLELTLRQQLESEVEMLQSVLYSGKRNGYKPDMEPHALREKDIKIASLMADIAKLEQKCLELSTENQMALDSATLPRDAMISHIERIVKDQSDTISELKQQKMNYIEKLYNVNKRVTDLESRLQTMQATITEKDALVQTLQEVFASNGDTTFPFSTVNENGNLRGIKLTRTTSSDDILLATPPPSPGRRRRFQTDHPEPDDNRRKSVGIKSPRQIGSLMKAASTEHLLSESKQPRSIPVKGCNSPHSEERRGNTLQMRRSLSNDAALDEPESEVLGTRPLSRKRGHSIPVRYRGSNIDLGQLTHINRVKSCDTGLDEKGVTQYEDRSRPQSVVEGSVRVLANEKKKLTNHFLDTLVKATSLDSLSSANSSEQGSPILPPHPHRVVHRFSAISPNSRKKSLEEAKTSSLPSCYRSASAEVLDNSYHYSSTNHQSLSDGEIEEGGVKSPLSMQLSPATPTPMIEGFAPANSNTPLSSLVTQRMTVKTDSLNKLPLTAWTTGPDSDLVSTGSQSELVTKHRPRQPCLV